MIDLLSLVGEHRSGAVTSVQPLMLAALRQAVVSLPGPSPQQTTVIAEHVVGASSQPRERRIHGRDRVERGNHGGGHPLQHAGLARTCICYCYLAGTGTGTGPVPVPVPLPRFRSYM